MLKIDLGCGGCKQDGFIGVDRFSLKNVDVVADVDQGLPFEADSVDLLYASHSLEHVKDLMAVMREIYRVCKHGAQICIVAPYNEQKLNLANPYHTCVFNEHTPRFWTDYPDVPIDVEEYEHPHAPYWGLSRSDHSNPGLDLRLIRMEFFYFPEYRRLSIREQRALRRERFDVCDQIMYHLIVWKEPGSTGGKSFLDLVSAVALYEPDYIRQRKQTELKDLLETGAKSDRKIGNNINDLKRISTSRVDAAESSEANNSSWFQKEIERQGQLHSDMRQDNIFLREELIKAFGRSEFLNDQLHLVKLALTKSEIECNHLSEKAAVLDEERRSLKDALNSISEKNCSAELNLVKMESKISLLEVQLEASNGLLAWYQAQESSLNLELSRLRNQLTNASQVEHDLAEGKRTVGQLYSELISHRSSKMARLAFFLTNNDLLWNAISPEFFKIKSYTENNFKKSPRNRFVLGDDLRTIPYREYFIPFDLRRLSKVSLGIYPLLPSSQGFVGIEVVSSSQQVLAQALLPLSEVRSTSPTDFFINTPLIDLTNTWSLRVFVREVDVPVAIYELHRYSLFSSQTLFSPFALFD